METFSALLAVFRGPADSLYKGSVIRSYDVYFVLSYLEHATEKKNSRIAGEWDEITLKRHRCNNVRNPDTFFV